MKVIFVIANMAGGGSERVISILANRFVQNGMDVAILMTAGNDVAYQLDERIHLVSAGGTSGGSMSVRIKRIANMRAYFKTNPQSIIISFGPGTSFFAVAADCFLGHRFMISERNDPAACGHPHLRNLVYRRAERMVFQTQQAMECFPEGLQKRGCVIPNPVTKGLPARSMEKRQKTVVAVGRLEKQKNHLLLLEAFSILREQHPEYVLHLFGVGSLQETLERRIKELDLQEAVVFEGFVKNVLERIKNAGMYVLSSDYEGISNSLLEAMAMGLPCISTDCPIGGSSLCIENNVNGILVPVGDKNALGEAMCRIAREPEFADELARRAYEIRETYSEENIGKAWEKLLYENHVCSTPVSHQSDTDYERVAGRRK